MKRLDKIVKWFSGSQSEEKPLCEKDNMKKIKITQRIIDYVNDHKVFFENTPLCIGDEWEVERERSYPNVNNGKPVVEVINDKGEWMRLPKDVVDPRPLTEFEERLLYVCARYFLQRIGKDSWGPEDKESFCDKEAPYLLSLFDPGKEEFSKNESLSLPKWEKMWQSDFKGLEINDGYLLKDGYKIKLEELDKLPKK